VGSFLWYENNRIHRVHVASLSTIAGSGVQKDVQNILLIGSTTRCGLAQQNPIFGLCSQGVTGVNSDVVMILHLDPDHHRASVLSIPRDTFVPNARPHGVNKIDAALADGPGQLVQAIEEDFGIPIQHYVELNFDSFQGVVNALGGIRMYFPEEVYDQESQLNVRTVGCQQVNGAEALAVVRARHLQYKGPGVTSNDPATWPYDPQSDLSRIRRDHEFLRVLASSVAKRGLGNFVTDLQLVDAVAGQLTVDQGFSPSDMANLVLEFHTLNAYQVPTFTLPVVVDSQTYLYRGGDYGDVVFPIQPQDQQVIAQFLGTAPAQATSGVQLPARSSITVAVENGGGPSDAGARTAAALQALGYTVTSVSDAPVGASTTEATVLYGSPASLAEAERVQADLSGLAVLGYDPGLWGRGQGSPGAGVVGASATTGTTATIPTVDVGAPLPAGTRPDIVVVTGSDFTVNAPAPASTPGVPAETDGQAPTAAAPGSGTTAASTAPTTTIPGLSGNPDLAPPSSPTETLQPWDPRSCTASGGEGP